MGETTAAVGEEPHATVTSTASARSHLMACATYRQAAGYDVLQPQVAVERLPS